ncbi:MAG: cation:proton antiporter, partial [Thermoguttaceae bacterium]|nr:cation:proton antiporter [Thermoguttaceae bacterium]
AVAVNVVFGAPVVESLVLGCVLSLSSTALAYRSFQDLGQADTKRAQATLGVLIFQDLALVPMLLLLPKAYGSDAGNPEEWWFHNQWADMILKSLTFCGVAGVLKLANLKFFVSRLAALRSSDLTILFAITILLIMCATAQILGLTPALGALAAGVVLGENRLTRQIDALIMPFREAFSAIFFISLGMLMDFEYVLKYPVLCVIGIVGAVGLKAVCSSLALRICGMDWRGACAFGLSISQIGELAFTLLTAAYAANAISESKYNCMLFVSVASLVATPTMVKLSLTKLFGMQPESKTAAKSDQAISPELLAAINSKGGHVIIVGVGHIGGQIAEKLISLGKSVALVDMNPVNLHP